MIVNRYILEKAGVSNADIISLQKLAMTLPLVDYFDEMVNAVGGRLLSMPHFKTSQLISALKVYKEKARSDSVPKTNRLLKILEDIEVENVKK